MHPLQCIHTPDIPPEDPQGTPRARRTTADRPRTTSWPGPGGVPPCPMGARISRDEPFHCVLGGSWCCSGSEQQGERALGLPQGRQAGVHCRSWCPELLLLGDDRPPQDPGRETSDIT